jgi:diguanylate cyclase (GGDEF)-like protein
MFAFGFGVVTVAFLVWMAAQIGGPRVSDRVDDVGEFAAAISGAALCFWRSRREVGRVRLCWTLIGAGVLSWGLGQAVWSWYDLVRGVTVPFPSLADAGFLGLVPLILLGVLLYPIVQGRALSTLRGILDGLILCGSLLAISWVLVLGTAYAKGGSNLLGEAIGLTYPIADVAIIAAALSVLSRTGRSYRVMILLLIGGMCALALSDSSFVYLTQTTSYSSGLVVDAGWVAGFFVIGLSALWPAAPAPSPGEGLRGAASWQVALPYALLVVAIVFLVVRSAVHGRPDSFLLVVAIVLVAAVLIRQLVVVLDETRLSRWLSHQATHDALTGLGNRVLFAEQADRAVAGIRAGHVENLAVLLCDLDGLKDVNDTLGHAAGDEVLVTVAHRLAQAVRPDDCVTRVGGDEFAVILLDIGGVEQANTVAIRIIDAMRSPVAVGGKHHTPRISIGIALSPSMTTPGGASTTVDDLFRHADVALYAAKSAGGDTYRAFDSAMGVTHFDRLQLQVDLNEAIESDQLYLEYEPIMPLHGGPPVGVEALVRWQHPTRGQMDPAEFVPVAEHTGAIVSLGRWVLDRAASEFAAWRQHDTAVADMWLAVNVSAHQFEEDSFITDVTTALARADLDPSLLRLELTEYALVGQDDTQVEVMTALRSLGVGLVIDDFGTGYSVLNYLRRLPVNSIKVDQALVSEICSDATTAMVVDSVIKLAHAGGIEVVAEGIENLGELHRLKEAQCDYGQGFLWTRSRTLEDLGHWLRARVEADGI